MDMPKPTAEHERLSRLAGLWVGEETLHPTRWDPDGGTATGRFEARMALDGFFLVADYEELRGGTVNLRAHAVYGWDARGRCYTMHWFDSVGIDPQAPGIGSWEGDVLTFEHQAHLGHSRYTYTLGDGEYHLRIENSAAGIDWTPFLDGTYRRVG